MGSNGEKHMLVELLELVKERDNAGGRWPQAEKEGKDAV